MHHMWRWAPVSSSFMAVSIIGFIVSLYILNLGYEITFKWGVTLILFFVMMFIASVISVSKAEPIPSHMDELAIHEHHKRRRTDAKFHLLHQKLEDNINPPKKGYTWQDTVMILFTLMTIYSIVMTMINPLSVMTTISHIILAITFAFVIYSIIDIFSSQKLGLFLAIIFTILVIMLGGIGVIIFYIYRKARNEVGK